jgi:hypothetical protein
MSEHEAEIQVVENHKSADVMMPMDVIYFTERTKLHRAKKNRKKLGVSLYHHRCLLFVQTFHL